MKTFNLIYILSVIFLNIHALFVNNNVIYSDSVQEINENNYINDEVFQYIKESYDDIDFSSCFNKGDLKLYNQYKEKFQQLLNNKIKFTDKQNKTYYINEYEELKSESYNPLNYTYYFFDADNDNTPELCITDETRFIYIMKYKPEYDEIVLWHKPDSTWTKLLGSGKFWFYSGTSPVYYSFYQLDEHGETKHKIMFYVESNQNETIYMLTLPFENSKAPKFIQKQSIEKSSGFYYKITEEQWNELTSDYFKSKSDSNENVKEIRFTYEELFDNII